MTGKVGRTPQVKILTWEDPINELLEGDHGETKPDRDAPEKELAVEAAPVVG